MNWLVSLCLLSLAAAINCADTNPFTSDGGITSPFFQCIFPGLAGPSGPQPQMKKEVKEALLRFAFKAGYTFNSCPDNNMAACLANWQPCNPLEQKNPPFAINQYVYPWILCIPYGVPLSKLNRFINPFWVPNFVLPDFPVDSIPKGTPSFLLQVRTWVNMSIPEEIAHLDGLVQFIANENMLNGTLPKLWTAPIYAFSVRGNPSLSGSLPTFAHPETLGLISLANNALSGTIPPSLANASFGVFDISNNQLSGTIPTTSLKAFDVVSIAGNRFNGTVPHVLPSVRMFVFRGNNFDTIDQPSFPNLRILDAAFNQITGSLPNLVSDPNTTVGIVLLNNNLFSGKFPNKTAPLIYFLDIQMNMLDGKPVIDAPPVTEKQIALPGMPFAKFFFLDNNRFDDYAKIVFDENARGNASTVAFSVSSQDVDECALGTHQCNQICSDGWNPRGSYTCNCSTEGYRLINTTFCEDIDECAIKKHNCSSQALCLNTPGTFLCCPLNTTAGVDRCIPCWNPDVRQNRTSYNGSSLFDFLIPKYIDDFPSVSTCLGLCDAGTRVITRKPNHVSCNDKPLISNGPCSFPCTNLTTFNTARTALTTLTQELTRSSDFSNDVGALFGSKISFSTQKKRGNQETFVLTLTPCPTNLTEMKRFTQDLIKIIVPNVPNLVLDSTNHVGSCDLAITSSDPASTSIIGPLVGAVLGCLFIVLILSLFLVYFYAGSLVSKLPSEVRWTFELYEHSRFYLFNRWFYRGSGQTGYYFQEFSENSIPGQKAKKIFETFYPGDLKIKNTFFVYNPVLIANFVGQYLIQVDRVESAREMFTSQRGLEEKDPQQVSWVVDKYNKMVGRYPFNKKSDVKIFAACHGTDLAIAEKISETGFASLSSLDAGFFGKGIYFTTYAMYCLPYMGARHTPAIVVSWLLPGNAYPVTEDHRSKETLMGAATKNGFNSHYVVTNSNGDRVTSGNDRSYDEIVIPQESQIVPAILFQLDDENIPTLAASWTARSMMS